MTAGGKKAHHMLPLLMHTPQADHGESDFALLDRAAAATVAADDAVALRDLFAHDALRVPDVIASFLAGRGGAVDLRLER